MSAVIKGVSVAVSVTIYQKCTRVIQGDVSVHNTCICISDIVSSGEMKGPSTTHRMPQGRQQPTLQAKSGGQWCCVVLLCGTGLARLMGNAVQIHV